ncbi:hypothetical protein GCM10007276_12930 [Agaricicola taiwanensis]|uniref:Uncharacterized protein n=1 Tax=Agaricicola taiwanensis TaxID=591372 RepID=A0A8J2VRC7_9RHOB|nr:hypothetical protein [Agaricicola taiwanensis]GGE36882.1 hypothetical protein GCM10007276_12930 [Agaricicola taiwanensis]
MTVVLTAIGVLLALWGFYVVALFDGIAAVDMGSRIIVGAAVVLGFAAITRAVDRLRRDLVKAAEPHAEPQLSVLSPEPDVPSVAPELPEEKSQPITPPPVAVERPVPPLQAPTQSPAPMAPRVPVAAGPVAPAPSASAEARSERSPFAPPRVELAERPVPDFLTRRPAAVAATAAGAAVAASAAATPPRPDDNKGGGEPSLLREGTLNGVNYRFFSDGSVEAEGRDGPHRYASVDELREEILARRGPEASPVSAAAADQRKDASEEVAPRPFEPLVNDHVGRDDLGAVAGEPVERDIPVVRPPRADTIGNDRDIAPSLDEVDRGLQDTDVSFEPADHDLAPALDIEFEDTFEDDGLFESREGEFGYDEPEPAPERGDRWSEALRMLLRRDRGNPDQTGDVEEEPGRADDGLDIGNGRR